MILLYYIICCLLTYLQKPSHCNASNLIEEFSIKNPARVLDICLDRTNEHHYSHGIDIGLASFGGGARLSNWYFSHGISIGTAAFDDDNLLTQ